MSDNVSVTTNPTVATDDIGGVHYQRVKLSIGADGSAADCSAANPVPVSEQPVAYSWKVYSDASFVTGDSPVTHDFNGDTGRNARHMVVFCDGAGAIQVGTSSDGATFGDDLQLASGEKLEVTGLSIDSVKVTWVADSSYRIMLF